METAAENKLSSYKNYLLPFVLVILLWIIRLVQEQFGLQLYEYGILPRQPQGLLGILFAPLIHGDLNHLLNNSLPLLVLGTGVVYFYKKLSWNIFAFIWIISGIWVWLGARTSYHIGASGIVYGLATFVFVSGIIKKYPSLMALSLLVTYLYGSMIWGLLPIDTKISFESHIYGSVAGLVMAIYYKNHGPVRPKYQYELEEEGAEEIEELVFEEITELQEIESIKPITPIIPVQYNYIYLANKPNSETENIDQEEKT